MKSRLAIVALACITTGCPSPAVGEADDDVGTAGESSEGGDEPGTTTLADTGTSESESESDGETTESETGDPVDYDCDALVEPFVDSKELEGPTAYHDVVFDTSGHLIGWDGFNSFMAASYDDQGSLYLPNAEFVQGMDLLDNGDIVYANDYGELRRVSSDLQVSVEASGLQNPYGVTVGPDQRVYVAAIDAVYRVDLVADASAAFVSLPNTSIPRATVFDLDSTRMFISTINWDGALAPVFVVDLDEDLDPIGLPVVFAANVGYGYHDGLGIDACGNLYVPDYNSSGLYRIDPQGNVTTLYVNEPTAYGHGLEWGSGIGGWREDAIYLPQPYDANTVRELVLGVPSGALVRTWAGG